MTKEKLIYAVILGGGLQSDSLLGLEAKVLVLDLLTSTNMLWWSNGSVG